MWSPDSCTALCLPSNPINHAFASTYWVGIRVWCACVRTRSHDTFHVYMYKWLSDAAGGSSPVLVCRGRVQQPSAQMRLQAPYRLVYATTTAQIRKASGVADSLQLRATSCTCTLYRLFNCHDPSSLRASACCVRVYVCNMVYISCIAYSDAILARNNGHTTCSPVPGAPFALHSGQLHITSPHPLHHPPPPPPTPPPQ